MRFWRLPASLVVLVALPVAAHVAVRRVSEIKPPQVRAPALAVSRSSVESRAGRSFVRRVGKILEVHLRGTPEEIGTAHSLLLYDDMVATERVVWRLLDDKVPNRLARLML